MRQSHAACPRCVAHTSLFFSPQYRQLPVIVKYAADKNHSAVKYIEIGRMLNVPLIYKYHFCGCLHGRVEVFQRYPSPLKTFTCTSP